MPMLRTQQKPLVWLGDSLEAVKGFAPEARREAGHQLGLVQAGSEPADWKPMETVGAGVREIRIHAETGYRVLYVAKFAEAVYIVHAFVKKTRRTPKADIDLANRRYRELLNARKRK